MLVQNTAQKRKAALDVYMDIYRHICTMVFFALCPGDVLNAEDFTAWPVCAAVWTEHCVSFLSYIQMLDFEVN